MARPDGGPAATGPYAARAFGLEIELSFEAPGLPRAGAGTPGRPTTAELVAPEDIDRDWPADEATRVLEESFEPGEPARTIDAHPVAGYRLYAQHFGLARISLDGSRIACSPPDDEPWSWQRFLVGRVLPWAAVLRGLEVLHASAVTIDGRAVAFVGPTGAGKTSLAIRLVARGHRFLTDDVLALERSGEGLVAHPGAGIAAVRPAEREAIAESTWSGLGQELGHSGKTYLELPRADGPVPLGAVYFLRLGGDQAIEPIAGPDPRLLLGNTFVLGVQTAERLRNQLEVCAHIAANVPLFWLRIAPDVGSAALAEAAERHATQVLAA